MCKHNGTHYDAAVCVSMCLKGNIPILPQWCVGSARISWNSAFYLLEWIPFESCDDALSSVRATDDTARSHAGLPPTHIPVGLSQVLEAESAFMKDQWLIHHRTDSISISTTSVRHLTANRLNIHLHSHVFFNFLTCSRCRAMEYLKGGGGRKNTVLEVNISLSLPLCLFLLYTRP